MDFKGLLHRFDGRSRLLAHALHSGVSGSIKAQTVFNKQCRSDPNFTLLPFLEVLCQQEACVDGEALVSKPLVCLFSETFKCNLLCFLHLIHSELPKDRILNLLQCLTQYQTENQWVCVLIKQLHRDIGSSKKETLLTSKCTEKLRSLYERFRHPNAKGSWASYFERLRAESQEADNQPDFSVLSQKKRKSENMDHGVDSQDDVHQSKRVKMDFTPAQEDEEESKLKTSQLLQNPVSDSQACSELSGSSKILPDHIKAAVTVLKELLDTETAWDESSVTSLKVLHECNPDEVEVLCSLLGLSEASEQSLPHFCSCLLELSPDLSHSTAAAVITNLLLGKILSLTEPASRCLLTAVTSLCTRYPRPTYQALIEPVLKKGHTGNPQTEMLCRLVEDCLEPHHRLLVFRTILEVSWDEGVLSVIHALLDSKLELSEEDFSLFTNQLCSQSPHFSKSMKFAKMMLSILTKYQSHVNAACYPTLSNCLTFNETFLKKSLQAALKRISL